METDLYKFIKHKRLYIYMEKIHEIKEFPDYLEEIDLYQLNINKLPKLPTSLKKLSICMTTIKELPVLPKSLETFICMYNDNLLRIPDISKLTKLNYFNCNIENGAFLSELPKSITLLSLRNSKIKYLPKLPPKLINLDISGSSIQKIPKLPDSIDYIDCSYTNIESLPKLPLNLEYLICSRTKIKKLPFLPENLKQLDCSATNIKYFPSLPTNLTHLFMDHVYFDFFPELPKSLKHISWKGNSYYIYGKDEISDFEECKRNAIMKLCKERSSILKEELVAKYMNPENIEQWSVYLNKPWDEVIEIM